MLASKCVFETAFTGSRILCEAAMHNKKFTTFLLLHWSVIFQLKLPLKQQNSIDPSQIIWCKLLFLMCIHTANHSHVSGVVLGPALYNSYVETVLNSQGVWTVATVPPLILLLGLSEKLGQTSRGRQSKCQQRVTVRRNKQLQGFLLARVHVPHNAPHCSSDPRQAAPPVVTRSPSTHATAQCSDPTGAQTQGSAAVSGYCLQHPGPYLLWWWVVLTSASWHANNTGHFSTHVLRLQLPTLPLSLNSAQLPGVSSVQYW